MATDLRQRTGFQLLRYARRTDGTASARPSITAGRVLNYILFLPVREDAGAISPIKALSSSTDSAGCVRSFERLGAGFGEGPLRAGGLERHYRYRSFTTAKELLGRSFIAATRP